VLFRRDAAHIKLDRTNDMSLLDLLVVPEAVLGCILGLLAAGLVHWLSPAPEPVTLEAGLVAAGFIGGLVVNWLTEKRKAGRERR
jgi:Na+/glutamate symporter